MRTAMGVACALVLLFLITPILALVPMSFSGTRWLVLPPTDLSIRWYVEFFTHRDWREATLTSLKVAGAAMVLASGLGTLAGVGLARARFPGRGLARGVLIAPLIVPVMIMAIASYWLFAQFGLIGSLVALVLAHGVLAVPYVVLNVEAATHAVDSRLEQAARMLGANGWQAFWRVTLPPHPGRRAGGGAVRIHHVARRGGRGHVPVRDERDHAAEAHVGQHHIG